MRGPTHHRSLGRCCVLAVLGALAASGSARAQADFPTRTIKFVVPLAAGGAADISPRIVAEKLSARWGQPVVIENRPGAGHTIGADAVAKAALGEASFGLYQSTRLSRYDAPFQLGAA